MPVKTNSQSHHPDFFNGLILGSIVGVAAYYLLATDDGKKLKDQLLKKTELLFQNIDQAIDEAKKETIKITQKAHQQQQLKSKKKINISVSKPVSVQSLPKSQNSNKSKSTFKKNGHKLK